ncbi:hypothetical protein IE53DRAFT_387555 [Violaceomyces palustris]|uniref:Uncharacterized protein n=1 Tax=Violaceomyces palustris TaxID=1673888 RepID=A0ACD0NWS0_9BASI|nr:hypothetical protein IE53DRAFT_387555 [Violaceomyces palustris]
MHLPHLPHSIRVRKHRQPPVPRTIRDEERTVEGGRPVRNLEPSSTTTQGDQHPQSRERPKVQKRQSHTRSVVESVALRENRAQRERTRTRRTTRSKQEEDQGEHHTWKGVGKPTEEEGPKDEFDIQGGSQPYDQHVDDVVRGKRPSDPVNHPNLEEATQDSYFGDFAQASSSSSSSSSSGSTSSNPLGKETNKLGGVQQGTSPIGNRRPVEAEANVDGSVEDEDEDEHSGGMTPSSASTSDDDLHQDEVVDYLDVVDPEIAAISTLQNVGNSIFFPPLPRLYSRRPTIDLPSMIRTESRRTLLGKERATATADLPEANEEMQMQDRASNRLGSAPLESGEEQGEGEDHPPQPPTTVKPRRASMVRMSTLSRLGSAVGLGRSSAQRSDLTEEERRKHVLEWSEMDEEERNQLDEHVSQLLTKKAKIRRAAKGFWKYVRTPMGFIITLYGLLITFWGTAIVLFIAKWIDVNNPARQRYWIEICDQILCALFAAVGLGFAPFRAVDTYRMAFIAHYHFLTYKKRKAMSLPDLEDPNELPRAKPRIDLTSLSRIRRTASRISSLSGTGNKEGSRKQGGEDSSPTMVQGEEDERERRSESKGKYDEGAKAERKDEPLPLSVKRGGGQGRIPLGQLVRNASIVSELVKEEEDVVVLTPKQQANLEYQQRKFHQSHTFYRYRETVTHRPFELAIMMAIVILLDCHSCLQASLGGVTWGINYHHRKTSLTATIITFSLSCNAVAGFLIWYGGKRTKKTEEVERLLRIALEQEALRKIEKRRRRINDSTEEPEAQVTVKQVGGGGTTCSVRPQLDQISEKRER